MVPVVVGVTIDRAIVTGDAAALALWLGVLAATFAVLSFSYRFGDRCTERASETAAHDLRLALARRTLHPRGGAADGRQAGELLSICTSDASRVGEINAIIGFAASAIAGIGVAAAALLQISLVLGALVLIGLPPLLVLIQLLGRPLVRRAASEQTEAAGATGVATDLIAGLRVLKGIGAEAAAIERYRASSRQSLAATLRAARAEAAVTGVGVLLTGAFLALVALVGGRLVADGRIGLGEFIAAVGLTGFLTGPLSLTSSVVAGFARARASSERVAAVLGAPEAVSGGSQPPSQPPVGAVSLRSIRHRGLAGLSLEVGAGEHVAIVALDAADGAALVELLVRAADPEGGGLELDGVAYTSLDPALLRGAVRVSAHDAELFDGSLSDNVRAAAPADRIAAALSAADVADVAAALPGGLDASLGERGRSLSGGQRQRVALARALASDAAGTRAARPHDRGRRGDRGTHRGTHARASRRPDDDRRDEQPGAAGRRRSRRADRGRRRGCDGHARGPAAHRRRLSDGGARVSPGYEPLPTATTPATRRAALALVRPRRSRARRRRSAARGDRRRPCHPGDPRPHRRRRARARRPGRRAYRRGRRAARRGGRPGTDDRGRPITRRPPRRGCARRAARARRRAGADPAAAERIERAGSGDLVSRVSDDVAKIAEAVREALPRMASAALTVGLTIVGLAALDWRLALAGLVAVPVQVHTLRWYLGRSGSVYAAERRAAARRSQQLLDSVSGAATVRAFGLGSDHVARVERRSLDALDLTMRAVNLITRFFARLNVAELLGVAAILSTGFLLVRSGEITVGQATAAALYFIRLFDPINVLLYLVDDAQRAGASLSRLVGIADVQATPEPPHPPAPADASVVIQGLRYAYVDGHDVLDGVDLEIAPGERVALIGLSGAGKTTLARVVAGILPPAGGRILLGGVALEQLGRAATARIVGLVSQEVHVFAGTLADDLRIARPAASDAELVAALERVGAASWVRALTGGLGTIVGDGGEPLTAQRAQQLALARVVLADRPVVILDEATAEAGSAGARALEAAAAAALEGRTALVVAHRLTQAAAADRVVVLESGRIVEQGTHAQLVARGGPYAALWAAWSDERS